MPAVDVPSPVGGWNARDALAEMPATDAVKLVNWIPRGSYVQSRGGYGVHASGLGGAVKTLAAYRGASELLVAAANGKLWDATGSPYVLSSGFSNDLWQVANHSTKLIFVNGDDAPQVFDGASVTAANFTGSPGGFTPADMWGLNSFKGRMFYWAEGEQSFWYATAGSYQGVMAEFDMSSQLQTGGSLVQMVTWTLDSGSGIDDIAVFIFSTGETLVYSGSDPGNANDWSLIGRFQIGEPMGPRAHAKVGGTEIIITRDGYIDLSAALKDGRYSEKSAYSAKIIKASKEVSALYGTFDGWEAILYPAGQLFIVNVPTGPETAFQHVRETSSGGWCEFKGWNAQCFVVFGNRLYFGDASGNVCLADSGAADNGALIEAWGVPAFNHVGSKGRRKQLTAVSIESSHINPGAYAVDGLADYSLTLRSTLQDDNTSSGGNWDASEWDVTDWSGDGIPTAGDTVTHGWRNCHAIGFAVTVSVRIRQKAQVINWYSTHLQLRTAGVF